MSVEEPFLTSGPVWLRDFHFGWTGLTVRKTGARVPYSPSVIAEVTAWFRYFFAASAAEPIGAPFSIAFTPERARPWYLVWAVSRLAGGRFTRDASDADVVMHFEDKTISPNTAPARLKHGAQLINFDCADVSKSRVSRVFEQAFGYALAVDPAKHAGEAVEKSEINGAHDGRILHCPAPALAGRAYQRLIDNRGIDLNHVDDLRTCTVNGKPIVVFIKRRPVAKRFQNTNSEVLMRMPEQVFSEDEIAKIGAFMRGMGMNWGAVDVLRDRHDGRLYVVDANKTDMGPPIALPLTDKMTATRKLAAAFRSFVER
ncbi:MAG: hypothetical protein QM759_17930 [Terricaulis sp.]